MQHRNLSLLNFARRACAAGVLLGATLARGGAVNAAPAPNVGALWISLGVSTLDETAATSDAMRAAASDDAFWKALPSGKKRKVALVVPILSGGRVFYATSVAPFAGRNAAAARDEAALRALLARAKKRDVAVYLSFDALGWDRPAPAAWRADATASPSLFENAPEREELTRELAPPASGPRYASPWAGGVAASLDDLAREAATRFPEAAGAVFDVHLSRGDVSGFNARERLAARRDLGFDPTTLNIAGTADEVLSPEALRWRDWRDDALKNLAGSLANSYRAAQPRDEVWIWGDAGYESAKGFDALRSGQDWARWLRDLPLSGVLLEGRWSEGDAARLSGDAKNIVPIVRERGETASLGAQWGALQSASRAPGSLGFSVDSAREWNEAFSLARGQVPARTLPALQINALLPELRLPAANGTTWSARDERGKMALAILVANFPQNNAGNARQFQSATRALTAATSALFGRGIRAIAVSASSTAPAETAELLQLSDAGRALLGRAPVGLSLVAVDRDGWVRAVAPLDKPEMAGELALKTTVYRAKLEVGQPAPDFIVSDMNGQERHLSALRGKKALLLSFFPKCFTGGCANHMASLDGQWETFAANDIEVLGVSIDAADVQGEFAARWKLRFALVPDTGRQLCFLYNAAATTDDLATRQTVFIDKMGVVRWIDKNVNVASHGRDVVERLRAEGFVES